MEFGSSDSDDMEKGQALQRNSIKSGRFRSLGLRALGLGNRFGVWGFGAFGCCQVVQQQCMTMTNLQGAAATPARSCTTPMRMVHVLFPAP